MGSIVGAAIAAIFGAQSGSMPGTLTLDQAVSIALERSFSVTSAQSGVRASEARVKETEGRLGITAQTNYNYLRNQREQAGFIGPQRIVFQPFDISTIQTSVNWQYDLAGNLKAGVRGARAGVLASRYSLEASVNDTKLAVRRAYIGVLRAKALVKVAEQGKANVVARVEQAERQLKERFIARIDVERLRAQVAAAEADLIAAENGLQLARQALNFAMALPIDQPVEVAEIQSSMDAGLDPMVWVVLASESRPDVKALDFQLKSLEENRLVTKASLQPIVQVSVQNSTTLDPAGLNPQREVNTAVVGVSVPLIDSGQARARVNQVNEQIVQVRMNRDQLLLGISQEVRAATTSMKNAKARLEAAKSQWGLAQEVVRIARIRRDAGEGTVLEIIDAETQWVQAQNGIISATYDYLTAYAELQRAVGRDDLKK